MRVIIQRVLSASVSINGEVVGQIGKGFVLLVGLTHTDTENDVLLVAKKVAQMRIFSDADGKMNLSLSDLPDTSILSISQFTLYADCRHGNRPSFIAAAKPDMARPLYELFNNILREQYHINIQTGRFGADMQVALVNDGPVTIILDSENIK